MRRMFAVVVLLVPLVTVVSASTAGAAGPPPTRLIIDTDFGQWWDDVAALAAVHAAADQGRAEVLGVVSETNLAQLLATDRELLARKVARTVIMGGEYPRASAPEWNFGLDLDATRQVVANWPTPVVFDGFEIGTRIIVGNGVCDAHPAGSPIRAAFGILYGCGNQQTDGTWDPTAAYYAIYGTAHVYRLAGQGGHNEVYPDGINAWARHGHHQQYLTLTNPTRLATALDWLVNAQPTA